MSKMLLLLRYLKTNFGKKYLFPSLYLCYRHSLIYINIYKLNFLICNKNLYMNFILITGSSNIKTLKIIYGNKM